VSIFFRQAMAFSLFGPRQGYEKSKVICRLQLTQEIVEIFNNSSRPINVSDWRVFSLTGRESFRFPKGTVIPQFQTLNLRSGPGSEAKSKGPGDVHWCNRNVWNNGGDVAAIVDGANHLVQIQEEGRPFNNWPIDGLQAASLEEMQLTLMIVHAGFSNLVSTEQPFTRDGLVAIYMQYVAPLVVTTPKRKRALGTDGESANKRQAAASGTPSNRPRWLPSGIRHDNQDAWLYQPSPVAAKREPGTVTTPRGSQKPWIPPGTPQGDPDAWLWASPGAVAPRSGSRASTMASPSAARSAPRTGLLPSLYQRFMSPRVSPTAPVPPLPLASPDLVRPTMLRFGPEGDLPVIIEPETDGARRSAAEGDDVMEDEGVPPHASEVPENVADDIDAASMDRRSTMTDTEANDDMAHDDAAECGEEQSGWASPLMTLQPARRSTSRSVQRANRLSSPPPVPMPAARPSTPRSAQGASRLSSPPPQRAPGARLSRSAEGASRLSSPPRQPVAEARQSHPQSDQFLVPPIWTSPPAQIPHLGSPPAHARHSSPRSIQAPRVLLVPKIEVLDESPADAAYNRRSGGQSPWLPNRPSSAEQDLGGTPLVAGGPLYHNLRRRTVYYPPHADAGLQSPQTAEFRTLRRYSPEAINHASGPSMSLTRLASLTSRKVALVTFWLVLVLALGWCACIPARPSRRFCDTEHNSVFDIHTNCEPCEPSGYCAQGTLWACKDLYMAREACPEDAGLFYKNVLRKHMGYTGIRVLGALAILGWWPFRCLADRVWPI